MYVYDTKSLTFIGAVNSETNKTLLWFDLLPFRTNGTTGLRCRGESYMDQDNSYS